MNIKLEFTGDFYEDWRDFSDILKYLDYKSCLSDIDESIRQRLKYDIVVDAEEEFLRELRREIREVLE